MADKSKDTDQPAAKAGTPTETREAVNTAIDAAAGMPAALRDAAEDLPEDDDVEKLHKKAALATDAQTEAKAKAEIVKKSPDASETPSGAALLKTAGIADDVKRGEAYAREKAAVRFGHVPVEKDK